MSRSVNWSRTATPTSLPALTIRQPWAWAIVEGPARLDGAHDRKDIENRVWSTTLRGPFLIHAAAGMTKDEYFDAVEWIGDVLGLGIGDKALAFPPRGLLERGGIVGIARLVGVIPPCRTCLVPCSRRWHIHDQYGFELADVAPLPFTPCKGALGFWEYEPTGELKRAIDDWKNRQHKLDERERSVTT